MNPRQVRSSSAAGFTLLEVLMASALMLPILIVVLSTVDVIQNSMNVNEGRASLMQTLHRVSDELERQLRPAALSTVEHRVTPGGAWEDPIELQPAVGMRFRCADGPPSMNTRAIHPRPIDAAATTSVRTFELVLEEGEIDNGIDDDGDGMVDEAYLMRRQDGDSWPIARGVESLTFTMEGRIVRVSLTCARRMNDRRMVRSTIQRNCFVRNN